jgi:hypothetical protein
LFCRNIFVKNSRLLVDCLLKVRPEGLQEEEAAVAALVAVAGVAVAVVVAMAGVEVEEQVMAQNRIIEIRIT